MIYITGDIHGDPFRVSTICERFQLTSDDLLILLGDVGANYYYGPRDEWMKNVLNKVAPTIFCIHGNHEGRPDITRGYVSKLWNGGIVYYQIEYPSLLFAKDGEIYDIGGKKCIAIGGAYSVDKHIRLLHGWPWFPDEQPSDSIKAYVEEQLSKKHIDVVFSHTCPSKYTPVECFLPGLDQSTVDKSTEMWLDKVESSIEYQAWYCGHWHINKRIDKMHFLFDGVESLD